MYLAMNKDGTGVISKYPLIRFRNKYLDKYLPHSYEDRNKNNIWIVDIPKEISDNYSYSLYTTIPVSKEIINKLVGYNMTWKDDQIEIN